MLRGGLAAWSLAAWSKASGLQASLLGPLLQLPCWDCQSQLLGNRCHAATSSNSKRGREADELQHVPHGYRQAGEEALSRQRSSYSSSPRGSAEQGGRMQWRNRGGSSSSVRAGSGADTGHAYLDSDGSSSSSSHNTSSSSRSRSSNRRGSWNAATFLDGGRHAKQGYSHQDAIAGDELSPSSQMRQQITYCSSVDRLLTVIQQQGSLFDPASVTAALVKLVRLAQLSGTGGGGSASTRPTANLAGKGGKGFLPPRPTAQLLNSASPAAAAAGSAESAAGSAAARAAARAAAAAAATAAQGDAAQLVDDGRTTSAGAHASSHSAHPDLGLSPPFPTPSPPSPPSPSSSPLSSAPTTALPCPTLSPPQQDQLSAALATLERVTQLELSAFGPRELSNSCWALAKLVSLGTVRLAAAMPLLSVLLEQAGAPDALQGAKPLELWQLAWATHSLKAPPPEVFLDRLASAITVTPPGSFQADHVIAILTLYAYAHNCHAAEPRGEVFSHLCSHLLRSGQLEALQPRHLPQLAFVCASVDYNDPELTAAIARRLGMHLQQLSLEELCGLVSCLSKLQYRDQDQDRGQGQGPGLYSKAAALITRALSALESGGSSCSSGSSSSNGGGSGDSGSSWPGGGAPGGVEARHVSRMWLYQSLARLQGRPAIWPQQAPWAQDLLRASMPVLLRCTCVLDRCEAVLTLTAELIDGNEAVTPPLLSLLGQLAADLRSKNPDARWLRRTLLLPMACSLPRMMGAVQRIHAASPILDIPSDISLPGASATSAPGYGGAPPPPRPAGEAKGHVRRAAVTGVAAVPAYAAALRDLVVGRLAELSVQERAQVSRALLEASGITPQLQVAAAGSLATHG